MIQTLENIAESLEKTIKHVQDTTVYFEENAKRIHEQIMEMRNENYNKKQI